MKGEMERGTEEGIEGEREGDIEANVMCRHTHMQNMTLVSVPKR